jgi:hypothetical protein
LVEQQPGQVQRTNHAAVKQALSDLNVPLNSDFAVFFLNYTITLFRSDVSGEQLCDIAEPTPEIALGTRFVHDVWELPEQFICITSVQGEGAYLYDVKTGKVWDFELGYREVFLAGQLPAKWSSFFEFMTWYLGNSE